LASDFQYPTLVACTADEKILMLDITKQTSRMLVESADLGKGSQLQSVAINQKITTFGIGSSDGRANISSIGKNINNSYQPVFYLLLRKPLSHSKATSSKMEAKRYSTQSTV
jgi:hypothetical protein